MLQIQGFLYPFFFFSPILKIHEMNFRICLHENNMEHLYLCALNAFANPRSTNFLNK